MIPVGLHLDDVVHNDSEDARFRACASTWHPRTPPLLLRALSCMPANVRGEHPRRFRFPDPSLDHILGGWRLEVGCRRFRGGRCASSSSSSHPPPEPHIRLPLQNILGSRCASLSFIIFILILILILNHHITSHHILLLNHTSFFQWPLLQNTTAAPAYRPTFVPIRHYRKHGRSRRHSCQSSRGRTEAESLECQIASPVHIRGQLCGGAESSW